MTSFCLTRLRVVAGHSDTDNIALSDNHFSGTIPNFSGNRSLLQKLNIIKLDRNNISGTLPTHLCDLGFLDQLFLGGNHIEGTIPNCFAKMMSGISRKSASSGAESSKQLQLTANQLSGTIPGATLHSDGFDRVRPPGEDAPRATVCTLDNFDVGLNIISGTLPKFVGAVQLRLIAAQYNRLSGTLPTEFKGLTSLNLLRLSFNELSGTLDKRFLPLPHEQRVATMPLVNKTCVGTHRRCYFEDLYLDHNHVEGTLPDWLGQMTKLEELGLQTNRLHGTLPSWLGNLHFLRLIYLNSNSFNGSLTGIPMQNWNKNPQCEGDSRPGNPEGCNGDRWYSRLNLYNNSLTGEFPSTLGGINYLTALNLGSNSLTGDLPNAAIRQMERLEKLQLNRNQFTGEVPDVAQLQHLKDLNINSNNFDAWPSGSSYWQQSNLVLMDCANNSLPHLPDPIPPSLTHLFINANPIADDLTALQGLVAPHLHVFDYSFINIPIVLNAETDQCNVQGPEDLTKGCFGPRVITPPGRTCHVGGAPPCQFHLQMYDADDQRLGTTGGLVKGLTFGLNSTITEPLVDNRDGSFTATVPPQWITSNGSQVFSFFHRGVEFIPERNALDETVMYDDDFALLRTVKFIPPDCPDRSRPNAAGAVCVCTEGYKDVHILDSSGSKHLQCERDCPFGTTPSPDHEHCECPSGQYNTKETGVVICAGSEWRDPAGDPGFEEYMDTVRQQLEKPPIYCRPCPRECTVCEHGHATLLEGWRVSGGDQLGRTAEAVVELISNGGSASPLFAFNCPAPLACPEIDMSSITNHTNASTVACLDHTLGPLCAACENGFSRQGSSQCSDCGSHLFETRFGLGPVPFVLVIIAIVIFLAATIGGATKYVLQRNEDLAVSDDGLRVKCNLKIVIGLAQVLPLLSDVLGNVFPTKQPDLHPVKTSMDYLGLAAVEVRSVFELDCWLTYYQSWIMVTFGLPCLVALITGLQFTRNIWLETRHEGSLIAAGTEMSDETESQPETEPEPEAPAQTRCQRWARSHAAADARTWLLFWVLLIYPVLSSNIFRIMQCRTLDDDRAVLERDYRVECSGTEYTAFYWMALVLTALIPFGVPVFVFFLLFLSSHRNLQQFQNGSTAERMSVTQRAQGCVASVCAPFDNPRNPDPHRTTSFVEFNAAKHRDSTLHQTTKNVRDACWWWEPIDLFRKLVLTGLLGFVRRGTVEQVLLGCCCSVFFLTLQSLLQPYRFHGSNVLKLAVECEIFIAFIVSFMLKGRCDISFQLISDCASHRVSTSTYARCVSQEPSQRCRERGHFVHFRVRTRVVRVHDRACCRR